MNNDELLDRIYKLATEPTLSRYDSFAALEEIAKLAAPVDYEELPGRGSARVLRRWAST